MNEFVIALLIFACLSAASLGCLFSYEKLPSRHRHDDTQGVVRLVANIFVVMTSLVLGLMINTAKNRFDGINGQVHDFATDLILLDKTLLLYGGEASDTHQRLTAYVERAANTNWKSGDPVLVSDQTSEQLLNNVGSSLRAITSTDNDHLAVWNDARQEYNRIVELRWALLQESEGSIPMPLLVIVVGWLVLIFASFGYRAPRNIVVVLSFLLSSALISGAFYLIIDMDSPFTGPISVSPAPLQRALAEMQR